MATKIEWSDEVWNFIHGCTKASPGCKECYAEKMAFRLSHMGQEQYREVIDLKTKKWNGHITFNDKAMEKPFMWKTPKKLFVNSMSDTFHEDVSLLWIYRMFDVIKQCPQHTFLILTKRPEVALMAFKKGLLSESMLQLPNFWMGVTAENQEMAAKRIPLLLQIPAAKRFVSIEPMLGTIDLRNIDAEMAGHEDLFFIDALTGKHDDMARPCKPMNKLDWVICGGMSGTNDYPVDPVWVVSLQRQCEHAKVPFLFKQWGGRRKKRNGRLVYGELYDQYPV